MSVIRYALATVVLALPLIVATSPAQAAQASPAVSSTVMHVATCPSGVIGWDGLC